MNFNLSRRTWLAILPMLTSGLTYAETNAMDSSLPTTVENFRIAQFRSDLIALKALVSPKLTYSHSNGRVQGVTEFLTDSTNGRYQFDDLKYNNPMFLVDGNVGIVRFDWDAQQTWADKSITKTQLSILMAWIKIDSEWQLLARSATKKS